MKLFALFTIGVIALTAASNNTTANATANTTANATNESSSAAPDESSSAAPDESSSAAPANATNESSSAAPDESSSAAPDESSSAAPDASTTDASADASTTDASANASTTDAPATLAPGYAELKIQIYTKISFDQSLNASVQESVKIGYCDEVRGSESRFEDFEPNYFLEYLEEKGGLVPFVALQIPYLPTCSIKKTTSSWKPLLATYELTATVTIAAATAEVTALVKNGGKVNGFRVGSMSTAISEVFAERLKINPAMTAANGGVAPTVASSSYLVTGGTTVTIAPDINTIAPDTKTTAPDTQGHHECVDLLEQAGANVDAINGGLTALMHACTQGQPECVDLLKQAGANVVVNNSTVLTALMAACETVHDSGSGRACMVPSAIVFVLASSLFN